MMRIVKASEKDILEILKIYDIARQFMRNNGNMKQWINNYPDKDLLLNDIRNNNLYMVVDDNGIQGVFAFIIGEDECYKVIEEGNWLNDEEYGTIHRIASKSDAKGIFKFVLSYCKERISNIRIDTHEDNKVMQHIIEKNDFIRCGIVYMSDKSERIAYQLVI